MVRQCHHQKRLAKVEFYKKAFNSIALERRPFLKSFKKHSVGTFFDKFYGSLVPNAKLCFQRTVFFDVCCCARSTVSQTVLVNVQKHNGFQHFCFRPFNSIAVERCRSSISLVIQLLFQKPAPEHRKELLWTLDAWRSTVSWKSHRITKEIGGR